MEERDLSQWTMVAVLVVLIIVLYGFVPTPEHAQLQPRIPTPTLGLRPVPTLMPTREVIIIERPAQPQVIDNSTNICVGYCPDGAR